MEPQGDELPVELAEELHVEELATESHLQVDRGNMKLLI